MAGFAFSFFFGILAASIILPGIPIILGSFLLSAAALYVNRKNSSNLKGAVMLVIFLGGMLNYSLISGAESKLDAFDGKTTEYVCLITDNPVKRGNYLQYPARSLLVLYEGKHYNFSEKIFLRVNGDTVFKFGDKLAVEGQCSDIAGKRNPGDFDYKLYYKSKGINKQVTADKAVLLKEDSAGLFKTILYLSREKVRSTINEALPKEEAAILTGIITGDKADMDEDMREDYMKTGLSHILSVSGLHVGFLMMLLTYLLIPLRLDKRLQGSVVLLIIIYYVLLIGAPLPSVRALIMLAVLMVGKSAGREYNLMASVSFACIVILLFKPMAVHDPGFMISFAAMYSITLFYPAAYRTLRFIPVAIRSPAALSISVWLGLAPVLAFYFNYVSIIGIIINIIAVPLSFMITVAGFIGVFAGIVSKTPALYIFSVDYYLIRFHPSCIQGFRFRPAFSVYPAKDVRNYYSPPILC
jgi:competence protein ComEC